MNVKSNWLFVDMSCIQNSYFYSAVKKFSLPFGGWMNTGIVTFHCSYNYGSALQAYALHIAFEKLGHKATIKDPGGRTGTFSVWHA